MAIFAKSEKDAGLGFRNRAGKFVGPIVPTGRAQIGVR